MNMMGLIGDWVQRHIAEQIQAIWDFTAGLTVTRNNIKNVSTAGIQNKNDTAADAVNTIQQSGYNSWKGALWRTDTSASVNIEFLSELIPVSGTANSAYLDFKSRFASDAFASVMKVYANGDLWSSGNIYGYDIRSSGGYGQFLLYGVTNATTKIGLNLQNSQYATSENPVKYAPSINQTGFVWNTTGAGSNETYAWNDEIRLISGTTTSSQKVISCSKNGGAYSDKYFLDSNGNLGIGAASAGEKLEVGKDTDVSAIMGRVKIGYAEYAGADYAALGHIDYMTSGNFGFAQTSSGILYLRSSEAINFQPSNHIAGLFSSEGWNLSGTSTMKYGTSRNPTPNTEGKTLTISIGGATVGATNKNGGNLIFSSGIATGSGSSSIEFHTATAGAAGTDDRTPSAKMFLDGSGNLGIGAASAGEKCEVTGAIKTVYVSDADSDTDDVLSTGITAKFGLVLIKETTGNKFCLFRIKGDNSAPIIIDGDAEFAAVKDNASTYNFYYETDQFKLQNKVGDDKALYVGLYLV